MNEDILITGAGDLKVGEITGCEKCGHLACVCNVKRRHDQDCPFRIAASCAVGVECEHGRDVCPVCDPCTCGASVAVEDFDQPVNFKENK